jgi:hypothetical protein
VKYIFPTVSIVLALGAAAVYAYQRDVRHALYWFLCVAITATVTY